MATYASQWTDVLTWLTPCLLALLACYVACDQRKQRPTIARKHPPGPKSLVVLGNVHQLPRSYLYKTLGQWGKVHGDLIFLNLFLQPAVAINSLSIAKTLLDGRSALYSDRPEFTLMNIMGYQGTTPFLPYSDTWRKHRKWMHSVFQERSSFSWIRPLLRREVGALLGYLLDTPDSEAIQYHAKRYSAALIMQATYGQPWDEEWFQRSEVALKRTVDSGSPAASLVDFFNFLRYIPHWMPGAVITNAVLEVATMVQKMTVIPYSYAKMTLGSQATKQSLAGSLIEQHSEYATEKDIKSVCVSVYSERYTAGYETVTAVLLTFFLIMATHGDVLQRAQTEIDEVIGNERLPQISDRLSLPYLSAILKELYRFNPPLPLGVPHRLMEDDEVNGYHIPKGCTVIPNIWQMSRDSSAYTDPELFNPDRFMTAKSECNNAPPDPAEFVFGFGRRICPGQRFADESLWLAIASVISVYDIGQARRPDGGKITNPVSFQSGFTSRPHEFACNIRPRSQKAHGLIMASCNAEND